MLSKPINNAAPATCKANIPEDFTNEACNCPYGNTYMKNSSRPFPVRIAITGGIGCGKSYVCHQLETAGYPVFYCDDEAKRIIRTDVEVRQTLTELIGQEVYDPDGNLIKSVLASYLCAGKENATRIDGIVHPKVAKAFTDWSTLHTDCPVVFMECALLFEAGFDKLTDITATIIVSEKTRLERLMLRDNIDEIQARKWMALQLPETEKQRRADFCLRNDDIHLADDINNLLHMAIK